MWGLAFALFAGCKWLTWRHTPVAQASFGRQTAYLLTWPGMDAAAFLQADCSSDVERPRAAEWGIAASQFALGLVLLLGAARQLHPHHPYWMGWVGMLGMVLALHFGAFRLLSCAWRAAGIKATPLMNQPLLSQSVSEFWGRRWNRAFRDLTHRFLFRPLVRRFGPQAGLWSGFLGSGLVHELVITVPARGGYGGPTLFFLLQALAITIEHNSLGRRLGLGSAGRGRIVAACAIILPLPLLFPSAFVVNVSADFVKFLGAMS